MAIGPVQLIVLGFDQPEFQGEIAASSRSSAIGLAIAGEEGMHAAAEIGTTRRVARPGSGA
jgi:hypothetical protein